MSPAPAANAPFLALLRSSDSPPVVPPCVEEWLVERGAGAEPALYAYSWSAPAVVLGYGQAADEVDLAACRADGVTVLRRRTGGTGVYVDHDLGVALALPREHPWARDAGGLYDRFLDGLAAALADVGQPVERAGDRDTHAARTPICFEGQLRESLLVGGRKAVGCAQMRRPGGALVHATLLLSLDVVAQARAFGVPASRIDAALAPLSTAARDPEALVAAIGATFSRALNRPLVEHPLPSLPAQLTDRYRDPRWCPVPALARRPDPAHGVRLR